MSVDQKTLITLRQLRFLMEMGVVKAATSFTETHMYGHTTYYESFTGQFSVTGAGASPDAAMRNAVEKLVVEAIHELEQHQHKAESLQTILGELSKLAKDETGTTVPGILK